MRVGPIEPLQISVTDGALADLRSRTHGDALAVTGPRRGQGPRWLALRHGLGLPAGLVDSWRDSFDWPVDRLELRALPRVATCSGAVSGRLPAPRCQTNWNHRYPCKEILASLTLNLALRIVAGLLAVVLLFSSYGKLFVPKEKLAHIGGATRWVEDFSPGALKAISVLELLAAAGLILPAALDIAPLLVPLAATGVVLLFVGAVTMRLRRGERATIIPDKVYLVMAAFVAWGRFGPGSFTR